MVEIPCVSGRNGGPLAWKLTRAIVAQFQQAFPNADIVGAGRRLRLHLETNPGKRKTHAGTQEYLRRWVTREVDRGGPIILAPGAVGPIEAQRKVDEQVRATDEKLARDRRGLKPPTPQELEEIHRLAREKAAAR